MTWLTDMLSYSFMQRALIVGVLISLCAALVGVPLVLRKNSMIGDGLSHTAFGAFALATVLGLTPLWFAIPVVIVASFIILRLSKNQQGDTYVALLSAASLAIGTIAISVSNGVNIDLNGYLFGSILSVSWSDACLSLALAVLLVALYIFAYHRIFAITFDEPFARSTGMKTDLYDGIFAVICSVIVVLGMRLLGALLISSLIIFPTLIAFSFAKSFRRVIITAAIVSIVNFLIGLAISYLSSTPTGATVTLVNLFALLLTRTIKLFRKNYA